MGRRLGTLIALALLLALPALAGAEVRDDTKSTSTLSSPTISGTVSGGATYTSPTLTTPTITGAAAASTVCIGSGTGCGRVSVVWDEQVSAAGSCNTATTSDVPVFTIPSFPANSLARNGQTIAMDLTGFLGANGNNKRFGVTFAGSQFNSGNFLANGSKISSRIFITRVDATHVNVTVDPICCTVGQSLNAVVPDLTTNASALLLTAGSPVTGAASDVCIASVRTLVTP